MKRFIKHILLFWFLVLSIASFAKGKWVTDSISVNGNCDMCKEKIESTVNVKGVKNASWNEKTKTLVVTYLPSKINNMQIQQLIADVGYDTEKIKATDKAYQSLHKCCQYERK